MVFVRQSQNVHNITVKIFISFSAQMAPASWRTDCVDSSDEINCICDKEDRFQCADKSGCISASKYCDQIRDCQDGSDENCTIDNPAVASENIQTIQIGDEVNISYWQNVNYRRGEWRGLYQNYTNYQPYCSKTTHV